MEDKSWIKLYRKMLQSPIFENEKALKIWIWCLIKATHKEREQLVGQQTVSLEKGQFITGRKKASEELKMKESTIYDYLKLLEKLQMIRINSNNKFSIISVEKWEDYQVEEMKNDNKATTKQHKQECKEIYLYLFNKIKNEIEGKKFGTRIKIMNAMKDYEEYRQLSEEEQDNLFNELMAIKGERKTNE